MPMKNPPHPGSLVKGACLETVGLTASSGAKVLGVSRPTLLSLINGRAGISPEMAIRLEKVFGGTADAGLRMQAAFDLAQARRGESEIEVERYVPA